MEGKKEREGEVSEGEEECRDEEAASGRGGEPLRGSFMNLHPTHVRLSHPHCPRVSIQFRTLSLAAGGVASSRCGLPRLPLDSLKEMRCEGHHHPAGDGFGGDTQRAAEQPPGLQLPTGTDGRAGRVGPSSGPGFRLRRGTDGERPRGRVPAPRRPTRAPAAPRLKNSARLHDIFHGVDDNAVVVVVESASRVCRMRHCMCARIAHRVLHTLSSAPYMGMACHYITLHYDTIQ